MLRTTLIALAALLWPTTSLPMLPTAGGAPSLWGRAGGEAPSSADSLEVVRLVSDSSLYSTLDYARKFVGRPYVAYTLDGYYKVGTKEAKEHLVVNLQEFDCLTLVETCRALAMTRAQLEKDAKLDVWKAYCRNLAKLRYFAASGLHKGEATGEYLDRMHYLTMSIDEHLKQGLMTEVVLPETLTRERKLQLGYMSQHPQAYYALKGHPEWVKTLAQMERRYSGKTMRFLPQENCGKGRKALAAVEDGDIVYIVTTKAGLDYAHQGFAFWGKDGRLHMLHASSAKKRVIEDSLPLDAYLRGISTSIGVRIFKG